jgi:hypothetical protein
MHVVIIPWVRQPRSMYYGTLECPVLRIFGCTPSMRCQAHTCRHCIRTALALQRFI